MNNLHKQLACGAMAICLLGACQPSTSPQYDLTDHSLIKVKWASGLTYGWGSLWAVADRDSNQIYQLTTEGKLQQEFRLRLAPDSPLLVKKKLKLKNESLDLEGIAADEGRNLLYVLSESNRMVLKVSLQGELVDLFPVQGHNTKRNQGLEGIAYSVSEDCLYLAEEAPWLGPKKIYCYTPGGEQIGVYQIDVNCRLTGLCFKNGSLLMINSADLVLSRHQILELNPPFESSSPRLFMDLEQDFVLNRNYEGIASDEQGNIYLVNDAQDNEESQLIRLSPSELQ